MTKTKEKKNNKNPIPGIACIIHLLLGKEPEDADIDELSKTLEKLYDKSVVELVLKHLYFGKNFGILAATI